MADISAGDRKRLKVVLDDDQQLNIGWALDLQGDRLLVDCGLPLFEGKELTVSPLTDDDSIAFIELDFREIPGRVINQYEDITVPTSAEYRFLVCIEITLDAPTRDKLAGAIAAGNAASLMLPRRPTHGTGTLDRAIWAD